MMKTLPILLFTMFTLSACEQQSTQNPKTEFASTSSPSAPGLVATSGPMTYTISLDGRLVTVSNGDLHRAINVDAVQRCGARAIGDPSRHDVEVTNTDFRVTYATRCTLKVMRDASGSSCDGCD